MKPPPIIGLTTLALALAILSSVPYARAAGTEPAVNPTGTWKVTYIRDGKPQAYQPTLKLKLQGDKLTGTLSHRQNQQDLQTALEDVKLEAGEISFVVSRPTSGNGPNFVSKFHGKITGDTMKGTVAGGWLGRGPRLHSPLGGQAPRRSEWRQLSPGRSSQRYLKFPGRAAVPPKAFGAAAPPKNLRDNLTRF